MQAKDLTRIYTDRTDKNQQQQGQEADSSAAPRNDKQGDKAKRGLDLDAVLHRELWTSWASMLRVYAAAHGLTSAQHAVVEIGAEEIVLRVGPRWVRFTGDRMRSSEGDALPFSLEEDGRVRIGDAEDEMDMAAERVAREMLADGKA